ncbi:MAG: triose-phosphate isomerase [Alphaproteobacteria bacterium]
MEPTPWIIGNWKMKGSWAHAQHFAEGLQAFLSQSQSLSLKIGVCPPFSFLAAFKSSIDRKFLLGGQDCAPFTQGAYTGDVGAEMLQDMGCTFVLVGHSERRQHHKEDAPCLQEKLARGVEAGLKVVLCVGETQKQREEGQQTQTVSQQLQEALQGLKNPDSLLIAYEPLWSIGTHQTPSPEAVQQMAHCIQQTFQKLFPHTAQTVPVLYGGSVTAENVQTFLKISGISGVLVGGASVDLKTFLPLIEACGFV